MHAPVPMEMWFIILHPALTDFTLSLDISYLPSSWRACHVLLLLLLLLLLARGLLHHLANNRQGILQRQVQSRTSIVATYHQGAQQWPCAHSQSVTWLSHDILRPVTVAIYDSLIIHDYLIYIWGPHLYMSLLYLYMTTSFIYVTAALIYDDLIYICHHCTYIWGPHLYMSPLHLYMTTSFIYVNVAFIYEDLIYICESRIYICRGSIYKWLGQVSEVGIYINFDTHGTP